MKKASESQKGHSSKGAVSQVRNGNGQSEGNSGQPTSASALSEVDAKAMDFLKGHDAVSMADLGRLSHLLYLVTFEGGADWLLEMGRQIFQKERPFPTSAEPVLSVEFGSRLYFALDELHGTLTRAEGLLHILSDRYGQAMIDAKAAPMVRKEANALCYLSDDVAKRLEEKFEIAWSEFKHLRNTTRDGDPVAA